MISCFSDKLHSVADERDTFKRHQTDSRARRTPHLLHPPQESPRQPLSCSQTCDPAVSGSLESMSVSVCFGFVFYKIIRFSHFQRWCHWQMANYWRIQIVFYTFVSLFYCFLFSRDYKDWFVLSYIQVNYYLQPLSMKHSLLSSILQTVHQCNKC